MNAHIRFRGPLSCRLCCAAELIQAVLEVSARRAVKGPRLRGSNWFVELATQMLKRQTLATFRIGDVKEARRYLDSVVISSPALSEVSITPVPVRADLSGLPPIYIQAGRAEILYDSIQAFADHAQKQGADVVPRTWEDMNHVFQLFGFDSPQSAEALRLIGQVIDERVSARIAMCSP